MIDAETAARYQMLIDQLRDAAHNETGSVKWFARHLLDLCGEQQPEDPEKRKTEIL